MRHVCHSVNCPPQPNISLKVLYTDFSQTKAPFSMEMTRMDLQELTELFEDTAEYFCDDKMISGQKLWSVLECLATAKLAELNGEIG